MAGKSRSAQFYAKNPEARKKKYAYDAKRNATPERKKYRAELLENAGLAVLWAKVAQT